MVLVVVALNNFVQQVSDSSAAFAQLSWGDSKLLSSSGGENGLAKSEGRRREALVCVDANATFLLIPAGKMVGLFGLDERDEAPAISKGFFFLRLQTMALELVKLSK